MSELSSYESTVNSFYLAFFGRPADPEGLAFWSGHLENNGGDYRFITEAFASSEEAKVRFGDDTANERIAEIYQQLFNRAPEADGLAFWTNAVEQGHASLADVAISILNGAQGTDADLATLRKQASADFTARVDAEGSDYTGYAAVEAARVLVRAVTPDATQEDIAKLVQAVAEFADIASNNPAVVDAIATGSTLLALFDTPRGLLDPVVLAQALADVAKAAAGNPATLESLLRGGGMAKVLDVMPAKATLQDVVDALADGGLPAAIDVVYPPTPVTPPTPSAPVSMLRFDSVESGKGDRDTKDHITKLENADVTFTYKGNVKAGQSFEYTIDGGKHWIATGIDTSTRGVVVLKDVDLTIGAHDLPPPPPPRMGIFEVEPVEDVLTTVQLRLVDGNDREIVSATETLVLDRNADMLEVSLVNQAAAYFGGFSQGNTNTLGFEIDGLEQGAIIQYQYQSPGANSATWQESLPVLQDGMHTIHVRQLDAAGNASEAREMKFNLNREAPASPTIRLANDTGIDSEDGVTNDATVLIEGLGTRWVTGWQYSVDDGKDWKFGGVTMTDGGTAELELSTLDIASGTLLVRQIDYAGNVSEASTGLGFTFDDTDPTETVSLVRIEGEDDGVLTTGQDKADLTFSVAGKDDGIVQWRLDGAKDWNTVNAYNSDGTFTLENIDLSGSDRTVQLQVIDAAGNLGFHDEWNIDGPFGLRVEKTFDGVRVTSSAAGGVQLNNVFIGSILKDGGSALVGQQSPGRSGTLTLERASGPALSDTTFVYLGHAGNDDFKGSNLWGFGGDDKLTGTAGNDFISGGDGNDTIVSLGGNDIISGGAGADMIVLAQDDKGSTLHYGEKETAFGMFTGGSIAGQDRILGSEAGDVIQLGAIFGAASVTVGSGYLNSDDAGQVAVIRGTLSGPSGDTFEAKAGGSSYIVQWTDAVGINSIVLNSYLGAALGVEVDHVKGTLTLVDAPHDDVPPTETLAFERIEGGLEGVKKTDETSVDVVFSVDGKNDGIVQWRIKGEQDWLDVTDYNGATFTIAGIDLSEADQTIELQVVDNAGNVGDTLEVLIDGPVTPFKVRATPEGLRIDSTVEGVIRIGDTVVTSNHGGAIDGRVIVGEQIGPVSGKVSITPAGGTALVDESGTIYQFGDSANDPLEGANLWGFKGNDTLTGTAGDDYLSGGDDNDEIYSNGGADTISGGKEADTIWLEKDGVGSTLLYQAGDTATGVFPNSDYMNGMDQIRGAELGDMIRVGSIFGYVDEIKSTFLTTTDADQVAVVRGNADSRFTSNPNGTSYMVQWTDGTNINSIVVNDFGAAGFSLEIDNERGIMTLVEVPPVISTFVGISFNLSMNSASFQLTGTPDNVVPSEETNGMLPHEDFSLYKLESGLFMPATGYDDGPAYGVDSNGRMNFAGELAADVYMMSWGTDTFATASGSFDSGGIMFAGGVDGNVVQQGFMLDSDGLQAWVKLDGGTRDRSAETNSLLYLSEANTTTTVTTGVHQDVVDATAGTVTIVYNQLNNASQDMIIGFGADDKIEIHLPKLPGKGTINSNSVLASDGFGVAGSATLATLKPYLDGRAISADAGTVFLVRDGLDAGMLIHYVNSDGDEIAEAGEITLLATFTGGLPDLDQIVLIGNPPP
ncbi:DUF4214 domain-containing protein [Telluria beijingensis]|uniref:DUF4214 domain-containing protein n=1 Tax=Telluria beijingensis TaxID=3068633 RepID=UPI0027957C5C|nr:DUF4214 domain-containing protein [Massilia sp. REN29]